MKTALIRLFALFLITTIISCSKDDDGGGNVPIGTGKVTGTVVTPSGKTVAGAKISASGTTTLSDINGKFTITLPCGDHELKIYTGQGNIFMTKLPVSIVTDQTIVLNTTQSKLEQIKQLAYIPGEYDMIQIVIIDSLGYNATPLSGWDLGSAATLNNFGAIFLNCGLLELGSGFSMNTNSYQNLLDYVNNHGSIYASDWAVECLTGDGNFRLAAGASGMMGKLPGHHSHPNEKVTATCYSPQIGGFIDDSLLCTIKNGPAGTFNDALILDPNLIAAVGNDSIDLVYDLVDWEMVNLYDSPFTPIMSHPFFGTIALHADLNTSQPHGNIYFTTFHNQPQGVSNDVEAILNYIILNL